MGGDLYLRKGRASKDKIGWIAMSPEIIEGGLIMETSNTALILNNLVNVDMVIIADLNI